LSGDGTRASPNRFRADYFVSESGPGTTGY